MKRVQKFISIIIILCTLLSTGNTLAYDGDLNDSEFNSERSSRSQDRNPVPCDTDDFDNSIFDVVRPDILYDEPHSSIHGDSKPTIYKALPYTAKTEGNGIQNSSYTNYYFTGLSHYKTVFSGSTTKGTISFDLIMHNLTLGTSTKYSYSGSSWNNHGLLWNDRNPTHNYCYQVKITGRSEVGSRLMFTYVVSKQ
jgi:hypothetical protein